jgi:hypothetical protein
MTAWICCFHFVRFCTCKRKFKGIVPQDFWLQVIFHESVSPKPLSKFAKVAKQLFLKSAITNPQISEIWESANFLSLIWKLQFRKMQIRKFVGEPVRKMQIRKFFTIRQRELNIFLKKFPPFIAKLSKVNCRFVWQNFLFDKNLN